MKIFFDEDNGTGIPKALKLVRVPAAEIIYPSNRDNQPVRKGAKDHEWIPFVGERSYLVFSQNKHMLDNEFERALLVQHGVGIVFLNSGRERPHDVMRMLLNRWTWLEEIDQVVPRPVSFLVGLAGPPRLEVLVPR